ncbi:MAG: antibiotic biosynthesis monooxygenase [Xanthobacteraceae bacterium]|nr:antibiotic biosynthesis monooxygenase [Xanthobacteraceae bacterium]MBX3534604.1 antibiotic biosynthesis monooxygenase [Xanthobacteraceae bacterium]MCW5675641.1 antibiotic biosynthesis monooxygenase [Xanthobacteraceae bacterium]MCW5676314.1 antibiotic biosynthesis monooxygenase [Xanthobacteraceae bacterium]
MSAFAIVATHHLKQGKREAWAALAAINAVEARKEQGCLQFDVVLPRDRPDMGILIERYVDEAAWNWHFEQSYCRDFMQAIETMLVDRTRVLCDAV